MISLDVKPKMSQDFPIQLYQNILRETGNAWAELQYRLHEERQGHWAGMLKKLPSERGVVYTCLFGEDTIILEPEYKNVFWDYVCFTDQKNKWGEREGCWRFFEAQNPGNWNYDLLATYYMINSHRIFQDYDFSIWISPEMRIIGELEQWYEVYNKNSSFLAFSDYKDDSIYDIIETTLYNDDRNIAGRKKMYGYRQEGYPEHYGLIDTRCIYKNHRDELLFQVLDDWWKDAAGDIMYGKYGFNYAAWKRNFKFAICDQFVEENWYIVNSRLRLGECEGAWE